MISEHIRRRHMYGERGQSQLRTEMVGQVLAAATCTLPCSPPLNASVTRFTVPTVRKPRIATATGTGEL